MLGHSLRVDDLCQDVLIKMLRGLPRLLEPTLFEPWFFRLARQRLHRPHASRTLAADVRIFDPATDDPPVFVDTKKRDRARRCCLVAAAVRRDRTLLLMAQEGLSLAEDGARQPARRPPPSKPLASRERERLRELYEKRNLIFRTLAGIREGGTAALRPNLASRVLAACGGPAGAHDPDDRSSSASVRPWLPHAYARLNSGANSAP